MRKIDSKDTLSDFLTMSLSGGKVQHFVSQFYIVFSKLSTHQHRNGQFHDDSHRSGFVRFFVN